MKIAEFTYKDLKNKITDRTVFVISKPSNKLIGIDVTELDEEDRKEFSESYEDLHQEFLAAVEDLKEQYDLVHNYRQFLETGITNLVEY